MTSLLKMLTGAAAAGLMSLGAAQAATTISFSGYQTSLNAGEQLVTNFDNPLTLPAGYSLTGTGVLRTGTSSSDAAPAFSAVTNDPTQYFSVESGKSALLTSPLLGELSIYIGSLDSYNGLTFHFGNGAPDQVLTGTDLAVAVAAAANGDQHSANTNGRYTFKFDNPINGVTLTSGGNSFEMSDIGAIAVPEPASWALMLLGFGGLGAMLRVSRRRQALASA